MKEIEFNKLLCLQCGNMITGEMNESKDIQFYCKNCNLDCESKSTICKICGSNSGVLIVHSKEYNKVYMKFCINYKCPVYEVKDDYIAYLDMIFMKDENWKLKSSRYDLIKIKFKYESKIFRELLDKIYERNMISK